MGCPTEGNPIRRALVQITSTIQPSAQSPSKSGGDAGDDTKESPIESVDDDAEEAQLFRKLNSHLA